MVVAVTCLPANHLPFSAPAHAAAAASAANLTWMWPAVSGCPAGKGEEKRGRARGEQREGGCVVGGGRVWRVRAQEEVGGERRAGHGKWGSRGEDWIGSAACAYEYSALEDLAVLLGLVGDVILQVREEVRAARGGTRGPVREGWHARRGEQVSETVSE